MYLGNPSFFPAAPLYLPQCDRIRLHTSCQQRIWVQVHHACAQSLHPNNKTSYRQAAKATGQRTESETPQIHRLESASNNKSWCRVSLAEWLPVFDYKIRYCALSPSNAAATSIPYPLSHLVSSYPTFACTSRRAPSSMTIFFFCNPSLGLRTVNCDCSVCARHVTAMAPSSL